LAMDGVGKAIKRVTRMKDQPETRELT